MKKIYIIPRVPSTSAFSYHIHLAQIAFLKYRALRLHSHCQRVSEVFIQLVNYSTKITSIDHLDQSIKRNEVPKPSKRAEEVPAASAA